MYNRRNLSGCLATTVRPETLAEHLGLVFFFFWPKYHQLSEKQKEPQTEDHLNCGSGSRLWLLLFQLIFMDSFAQFTIYVEILAVPVGYSLAAYAFYWNSFGSGYSFHQSSPFFCFSRFSRYLHTAKTDASNTSILCELCTFSY